MAATTLLAGCGLLGKESSSRSTITLSCGSAAPVTGLSNIYLTMPEPRTAVLTYISPTDGAHSKVVMRAGETCLLAPAQ